MRSMASPRRGHDDIGRLAGPSSRDRVALLQGLQIIDDLLALAGVGDAAERLHFVAAHDLVGIADELVEGGFIPGDPRAFMAGENAKPSIEPALRPTTPCSVGPSRLSSGLNEWQVRQALL